MTALQVKGQGNLTCCLFGAFLPVALSLWFSIRASDWDAVTAPLSHRQHGGKADWWPKQVRGVGWWVGKKQSWAGKKSHVFVNVCIRKHREERKKQSLCRSTAIVHVREEERDAFSYSCLSASVAHSSETSWDLNHVAASARFPKKQKTKHGYGFRETWSSRPLNN